VIIRKQNEKLFSIRKLKDIEGTYFIRKQIIAINKYTTRQLIMPVKYLAQIVDLTINESSDGGFTVKHRWTWIRP
jgi:hypothetical protein